MYNIKHQIKPYFVSTRAFEPLSFVQLYQIQQQQNPHLAHVFKKITLHIIEKTTTKHPYIKINNTHKEE